MATTVVHQHVRASPERVYAALLDASAVKRWMVPDGMSSEVHVFEPRVGGAFPFRSPPRRSRGRARPPRTRTPTGVGS